MYRYADMSEIWRDFLVFFIFPQLPGSFSPPVLHYRPPQVPLIEGAPSPEVLANPSGKPAVLSMLDLLGQRRLSLAASGASVIVRVQNPLMQSVVEVKDWRAVINTKHLNTVIKAASKTAHVNAVKFAFNAAAASDKSLKSTASQLRKTSGSEELKKLGKEINKAFSESTGIVIP